MDPNNPATAAYARRIATLEETIRVQSGRLKLLDFAARQDVWITRSNFDTYRVFVENQGGRWAPTLEEALGKAMCALDAGSPPTPEIIIPGSFGWFR